MKAKASSPKAGKATAKAKPRRAAVRFLVTFDHLDDPAPGELDRLVARLRETVPEPMTLEVATPAAVVVEGSAQQIRKALTGLKHWVLSPEGRLSAPPPSHLHVKSTS